MGRMTAANAMRKIITAPSCFFYPRSTFRSLCFYEHHNRIIARI